MFNMFLVMIYNYITRNEVRQIGIVFQKDKRVGITYAYENESYLSRFLFSCRITQLK